MKYGIVYYKDTDNIGDDIQNYAVRQFLPQVDYLIDREDLADFKSEGHEPVAVILNGWYMHNKFNWPPSKDIYPLCVSIHFSQNDYLGVKYNFLDGIGGEYLKNYSPIGCRDSSTLAALEKKGIECYLSGCVTLTLPQKKKDILNKEYVCIVDVPEDVEQSIEEYLSGSDIELKKMTHWVDYKKEPLSWESRMEKVESLLNVYQNAKCVVTKRLHCALPCLAMGTPVLLILDEDKDDVTRYSFFTELLHVISSKDYIEGRGNYDIKFPLPNKGAYVEKRELIIKRIKSFVAETESMKLCSQYKEWLKKEDNLIRIWRMNLLKEMAQYAAQYIDEILRKKNHEAVRAYDEIQKIGTQYEIDTNLLKQVINENTIEIERLEKVIIEKNEEEQRLNNVVMEKNEEERRLNNVIIEKNEEERRLNNVIIEKNEEERRLNDVIIEKNEDIQNKNQEIAQYKPTYEYIQKLEKKSIIWLVCFSKKFRSISMKGKIGYIFETIKNRKEYME